LHKRTRYPLLPPSPAVIIGGLAVAFPSRSLSPSTDRVSGKGGGILSREIIDAARHGQLGIENEPTQHN
jgi:hypothetical protein